MWLVSSVEVGNKRTVQVRTTGQEQKRDPHDDERAIETHSTTLSITRASRTESRVHNTRTPKEEQSTTTKQQQHSVQPRDKAEVRIRKFYQKITASSSKRRGRRSSNDNTSHHVSVQHPKNRYSNDKVSSDCDNRSSNNQILLMVVSTRNTNNTNNNTSLGSNLSEVSFTCVFCVVCVCVPKLTKLLCLLSFNDVDPFVRPWWLLLWRKWDACFNHFNDYYGQYHDVHFQSLSSICKL